MLQTQSQVFSMLFLHFVQLYCIAKCNSNMEIPCSAFLLLSRTSSLSFWSRWTSPETGISCVAFIFYTTCSCTKWEILWVISGDTSPSKKRRGMPGHVWPNYLADPAPIACSELGNPRLNARFHPTDVGWNLGWTREFPTPTCIELSNSALFYCCICWSAVSAWMTILRVRAGSPWTRV